jgi:hypothetical protein
VLPNAGFGVDCDVVIAKRCGSAALPFNAGFFGGRTRGIPRSRKGDSAAKWCKRAGWFDLIIWLVLQDLIAILGL